MDKGRVRLVQAATAVEADLRRTTGRPWRCSIDPGLVLVLADGDTVRHAVLDPDVLGHELHTVPGGNAQDSEDALTEAARDAVTDGVMCLLEQEGVRWPDCPDHPRWLTYCGGWNCDGPPVHGFDLGRLGD